jgi:hypothetical protein
MLSYMGDIMTVSVVALVAGFAAAGLWFIAKVAALYLPIGISPGEALS